MPSTSAETSADFNNANGVSLSNASIIDQWDTDNPRPPSHSPNFRDWYHDRCALLRRLFLPTAPPLLSRAVRDSPPLQPFQGVLSTPSTSLIQEENFLTDSTIAFPQLGQMNPLDITEVSSPTSSFDSFFENPIPFPTSNLSPIHSSTPSDNWMDIHNDHTFGGNSNELTPENEPILFGQDPPVTQPPVITSLLSLFDLAS